MYIKIFLPLILILNVHATQVDITNKLMKYSLQIDSDKIHYKGHMVDLTFSKKKCNEHIFNELKNKTEIYLNPPFAELPKDVGFKISIDHKTYFEPLNNNRVKFFSEYLDLLKSSKLEEELNCK